MVAQVAIPIATAVGEFAAPYLLRKAGEIGLTRFIQVYGSAAATAIGIQKTQPVDLQTEKIMGMPVSHITGQGEVYDDIDYSYIDEDKENDEVPTKTTEEKLTEPTEPEPPKGPDVSDFLAETAIHTARKGTEELLKKKEEQKDIAKQTKDLVTKEPEFGALTEVEKQTALLEKGDKPDFYSRAIKSIEDAKPNKLTKTKWKSYIQSTKEELDYLGLTEFLKGNESITKQELLDFVKGKDLASTMTVRTIPKDQMNVMWESYSLGGGDVRGFKKREHIVFQKRKDADFVIHPAAGIYKEPHFDTEYGTGTFAHARTQVGYDPALQYHTDFQSKDVNEFEKTIKKAFDNTLIIDEIQSQWIQEGQDKGFVSDFDIVPEDKLIEYFKKNKIFYKLSEGDGNPVIEWQQSGPIEDGDAPLRSFLDSELNPDYIFNKSDKTHYETLDAGQISQSGTNDPVAYLIYRGMVPDLPIKDSKKFVELVLNEMIRKAVKDGRDSVAITNGQIQYNRYEAMEEKDKQGLKKFYDTFVYDQLNKIAKNYGVELERIDIGDPEQAEIDQTETQIQFPRKVKTAQTAGYKLEKITLEELWDILESTPRQVPGHTALYSNQGRGQGFEYFNEYFANIVDSETFPADPEFLGRTAYDRWEKIKHNEVYIWKTRRTGSYTSGAEGDIVWDMPIVPVADTLTNVAVRNLVNATTEDREYILRQFTRGGETGYPYEGDNINNTDLIKYTEYLRNYTLPEGVDLGYEQDVEQLIKMKLPKKLQKEILKKPIRLTKVKQQTDRMFG